MEENTFATSAYIAVDTDTAFDYLCSLKNLDDWTLFSRMIEQVDEDTWLGTASGYQHNLYYHVKRIDNGFFKGIEWHCGIKYKEYFQVYPVMLFPPDYIEPGTDESGVYFHWLSFVDPKRRTPMIMQGIETVHTSECRSLKAILERNSGRTEAARGRYKIVTDTMFIHAPIEMGYEYLSDLRTMDEWAHLLRPAGEIGSNSGEFLDEYNQKVQVELRSHTLSKYYLIEQDFYYPEHNFIQRSPSIIIPCSYAFADPDAEGFIQHRITFWPVDEQLRHGKLQIQDFGAESMNIKRFLEGKAGNLESFAQGMSYQPKKALAKV
ncbi:MAG: scytonemin biosynthesis cyclase/decarboxylase ScyC [Lyngbya sp.]|nr:scytonemin biosynthesis cyclase/decarboxylase ScyC [Lyngbya sp.]